MAEDKRIEIVPGGPYRVYGGIPLKEMAPVLTFNGEPIDWHLLGDISPAPADYYDLCRCGQSKTRPFCDSTHESITWDGAATASRLPYRERAGRQRHGDERLLDDQPLCISAGFCGTRTVKVWDLFENAEEPGRRRLMREMVWRCPSGRIALYGPDGFPTEAALPQEIAVLPGGPLWVRGGIQIIGEDGVPWEPRNRVTACRCGQSQNQPFCDGTHEDIHFDER